MKTKNCWIYGTNNDYDGNRLMVKNFGKYLVRKFTNLSLLVYTLILNQRLIYFRCTLNTKKENISFKPYLFLMTISNTNWLFYQSWRKIKRWWKFEYILKDFLCSFYDWRKKKGKKTITLTLVSAQILAAITYALSMFYKVEKNLCNDFFLQLQVNSNVQHLLH